MCTSGNKQQGALPCTVTLLFANLEIICAEKPRCRRPSIEKIVEVSDREGQFCRVSPAAAVRHGGLHGASALLHLAPARRCRVG